MKTLKKPPRLRKAIERVLGARDDMEMAAVDRLLARIETPRRLKAPRARRKRGARRAG
jgi:hypothetical protein